MNALTPLTAALDLSAIMRAEGIVDIHRDRLLDRFSVTLDNWSLGVGATVGEALEHARRQG